MQAKPYSISIICQKDTRWNSKCLSNWKILTIGPLALNSYKYTLWAVWPSNTCFLLTSFCVKLFTIKMQAANSEVKGRFAAWDIEHFPQISVAICAIYVTRTAPHIDLPISSQVILVCFHDDIAWKETGLGDEGNLPKHTTTHTVL